MVRRSRPNTAFTAFTAFGGVGWENCQWLEREDMSPAEAIKAAHADGIELRTDGDDLLLTAAAPPPPAVLKLISLHKAAILLLLRPVPIATPSREAPFAWLEGAARLRRMKPPAGVMPDQFERVRFAGEAAALGWAGQAAVFGWSAMELYGCQLGPHPLAVPGGAGGRDGAP